MAKKTVKKFKPKPAKVLWVVFDPLLFNKKYEDEGYTLYCNKKDAEEDLKYILEDATADPTIPQVQLLKYVMEASK